MKPFLEGAIRPATLLQMAGRSRLRPAATAAAINDPDEAPAEIATSTRASASPAATPA